jgi:cytochrome c-type biogenesis protein
MIASALHRMAQAMAAGSPWLLPLAFLSGLCTSLNPCVYPTLAAVAGYVGVHSQGSYARSVLLAGTFLVGLSLTYAALGLLAGSFVAPILGLSRRQWFLVVGVVCLAAGICMADLLPLELPGFSLAHRWWGRLVGVPGALVLGALLGLVATPCATPRLAVLLTLATAHRGGAFGAWLLLVYGLGHGLPAMVMGSAAGALTSLDRLGRHTQTIRTVGGWLLMAVGLYLLLSA